MYLFLALLCSLLASANTLNITGLEPKSDATIYVGWGNDFPHGINSTLSSNKASSVPNKIDIPKKLGGSYFTVIMLALDYPHNGTNSVQWLQTSLRQPDKYPGKGQSGANTYIQADTAVQPVIPYNFPTLSSNSTSNFRRLAFVLYEQKSQNVSIPEQYASMRGRRNITNFNVEKFAAEADLGNVAGTVVYRGSLEVTTSPAAPQTTQTSLVDYKNSGATGQPVDSLPALTLLSVVASLTIFLGTMGNSLL